MALTKDKLVIRLQTQLGLTKPESRQMVERLFGLMKDTLTNGEDLLVSGFGKFSVRKKNERRGRNPQTRESLILPARKVLVFKASGVLRERINERSQISIIFLEVAVRAEYVFNFIPTRLMALFMIPTAPFERHTLWVPQG